MMKHIKCRHCPEKFLDEDLLAKHLANDHKQETNLFSCAICNKKFQYKGSLTDHFKTHENNDIRYECTECPCFFKYQGHLKSHMKDAHGSKKQIYRCKECPKKFEVKSALQQHIQNIHNAVLILHKCPTCPRVYTSKNSLKWHIHINHNKDYKRSKCPYCPSDFKWPHHLKVHIRKAHIEKGHAPTDLIKNGLSTIRRKANNCIVCDEKFGKKLDLMLHLKKIHRQDLDIFKCCMCDAVFSLRNSMKLHLDEHKRKKTSGEHKCDQCHPESNPTALLENNEDEVEFVDKRTEIEKEIEDFEMTLMEDEDLRALIKYRIKKEIYSKRHKNYNNNDVPIKLNNTELEVHIKEDNSSEIFEEEITCLDNEILPTDEIIRETCKECKLQVDKCNCSTSRIFNQHLLNKEVKVCLKRLTANEMPVLNNLQNFEYKCDVCSCNFTLSMSLEQHMKLSHGDQQNIVKDILKESNNDKQSNMKLTKKKIYQCKICNEKFTTPLSLGRHIRLTHRSNYKCKICKITFKNQKMYADHIRFKHKDMIKFKDLKSKVKWSPKKTSVRCVNPKSLQVTDKMYECGKCELFYSSKLELLRHISDVHMANTKRTAKIVMVSP